MVSDWTWDMPSDYLVLVDRFIGPLEAPYTVRCATLWQALKEARETVKYRNVRSATIVEA